MIETVIVFGLFITDFTLGSNVYEKEGPFQGSSFMESKLNSFTAYLCDGISGQLECRGGSAIRILTASYGHNQNMKGTNRWNSGGGPTRGRRLQRSVGKEPLEDTEPKVAASKACPPPAMPGQMWESACTRPAQMITKKVQNACNGNRTCQLWPNKFKAVDNYCQWSHFMEINYLCAPVSVKIQLILADTYLEVQCKSFPDEEEKIIVVSASLTSQISLDSSAKNLRCPDVDISEEMGLDCNRKETCTALPPRTPFEIVQKGCKKMNLKLIYACMRVGFFKSTSFGKGPTTRRRKPPSDRNRGGYRTPIPPQPRYPSLPPRDYSSKMERDEPVKTDGEMPEKPKDKLNIEAQPDTNYKIILSSVAAAIFLLVLVLIIVISRRYCFRRTNRSSNAGGRRSKTTTFHALARQDKFLPPASPQLDPPPYGLDLLSSGHSGDFQRASDHMGCLYPPNMMAGSPGLPLETQHRHSPMSTTTFSTLPKQQTCPHYLPHQTVVSTNNMGQNRNSSCSSSANTALAPISGQHHTNSPSSSWVYTRSSLEPWC